MSKTNFAPIVELDAFSQIRDTIEGSLVLTSGGFDPIHPGHISCIVDSKQYGDQLVVVVNGDWFLDHKKGRHFMNLQTRCEVVSAIRGVDFVVPFEIRDDVTVNVALETIQPDIFTKGGDRTDASNIPEWDTCVANGIEVVTGVGDSKVHSSSNILEDWYQARLRLFVENNKITT
jgi:cytidyltransferase-like protein